MEALKCRKLGDQTTASVSDENSPNFPIPELRTPTVIGVKATEKPPLPFVPGSDYFGVVDSIASKVTMFKVEDLVCRLLELMPALWLLTGVVRFRIPEGCDLISAGALHVAFGTSHLVLVHRANLTSGQANLAFAAIKDRKVMRKVMIEMEGDRSIKSKL